MDGGFYDGAYYLAGYAIECAFKACIAKQTSKYDFPPERKIYNKIYTHDFLQLLDVSGLKKDLESESNHNPSFAHNWTLVKDWKEQSRYHIGVSEAEARDLLNAITAPKNGVLSWLKERW